MPVKRLKELLDQQQVKYVLVSHSPAYTAQEIAAVAHIPGREMAKTVMVRVDGKICMAVLPASRQIDFTRFKQATGADQVELVAEEEFKGVCPDCEVGAMPPFGSLYDLDLFVDHTLSEDDEIYFNAGTHRELIKMSFGDYHKITKPKIITFCRK